MKKTLITNINDLRLHQIASTSGYLIHQVNQQHYFTPLKNILLKKYTKPLFNMNIPETFLVICNTSLEEDDLDSILAMIKEKKIRIDYKAILTPYNQEWTLFQLMQELKKEKEGMK